ncbi:DUF6232 family protein [Streptomyces sp. H51]|uniref:DUF6232 family protein n=1 Tax=Streptomyces sp. H51 TaxID=3111770 RepID=UPI002D76B26B|nr:DUF6232 family protein [Streptomyces sp. H51]
MSGRLLWVGEAAYPLHNISRVHTFVLKPKRAEAVNDFLKWTALTAAALVALQAISQDASSRGQENGSVRGLGALGLVVVIGLFVRMLKMWNTPPEHVPAVETASGSTSLVTLPDPAKLRQLVLYIVNAIENPGAEFHVRVASLQVNPENYQFGDTVNMYGGLHNTGMTKK